MSPMASHFGDPLAEPKVSCGRQGLQLLGVVVLATVAVCASMSMAEPCGHALWPCACSCNPWPEGSNPCSKATNPHSGVPSRQGASHPRLLFAPPPWQLAAQHPPLAHTTHTLGGPNSLCLGVAPLCCKQLQVGHEARAEPCPAHGGHAAAGQVQCPMGCALRGLVWAHNLPATKWQMPNHGGKGPTPQPHAPALGGGVGPRPPLTTPLGLRV